MALSPVRLRASMSVGSPDTIAFTRSNSPALIASMKAALVEVVSGMPRFYRAVSAGLKACTTPVVQTFRSAVFVAIAATAHAQTPPAPAPSQERPPLGASITVDALGSLPASANLFSLLDTVVPDVIADRIDTRGLSAGAAAPLGAHTTPWTPPHSPPVHAD